MQGDKRRREINPKYIQFFILAALFFGFMFFIALSQPYESSTESEFVSFDLDMITVTRQGDIRIAWDLSLGPYPMAANIYFGLFFYDEYGERVYISEYMQTVEEDEITHYIGVRSGHELLPYPLINLEYLANSLHAYANIAFYNGTSYGTIHLFDTEGKLWVHQ